MHLAAFPLSTMEAFPASLPSATQAHTSPSLAVPPVLQESLPLKSTKIIVGLLLFAKKAHLSLPRVRPPPIVLAPPAPLARLPKLKIHLPALKKQTCYIFFS